MLYCFSETKIEVANTGSNIGTEMQSKVVIVNSVFLRVN